MSWFKADDGLPFHRKTIKAGNAAMGLWIRAGTWLRGDGAREEHPDTLTYAEARTMGSAAEIKRLIDAGFWEACKLHGERAVRFHDWETYQPPSEVLEDKRNAWADRKRRSRKHRQGDHSECLPGYCAEVPLEDDDDHGDGWPASV